MQFLSWRILQDSRDADGAAIAVFTARFHNPLASNRAAKLQSLVAQLDAALERFVYDLISSIHLFHVSNYLIDVGLLVSLCVGLYLYHLISSYQAVIGTVSCEALFCCSIIYIYVYLVT